VPQRRTAVNDERKTFKMPEIELRLYVRIESLTRLACPGSFIVLALSGQLIGITWEKKLINSSGFLSLFG
jgi:hypothetical protein